jgi:hypothetical protein
MGLAVAGLKPDEIAARTKKLAEGDWSDFSPAEQLAFQFAYKQAKEPGKLTDADVRGLTGAFGRHQALDLVWYGGWCNYMTRVADAFQLPLEKENVFAQPKKDGEKDKKVRKPDDKDKKATKKPVEKKDDR